MADVIQTATNQVTQSAPFPPYATNAVAVNNAATYAYAASGPTLAKIDLVSGTIQTALLGPTFVTLSPDDSIVYALPSNLCAIDAASLSILGCAGSRLNVNEFVLRALLVSTDGTRIYVNTGASIGEFDAATLQSLRSVTTPGNTTDCAYSSESHSLYFLSNAPLCCTTDLNRIDLTTFTLATSQPLSYQATGLAVSPDGSGVYVAESSEGIDIFNGQTLVPEGSIETALAYDIAIVP